jgi:hypothetical protein
MMMRMERWRLQGGSSKDTDNFNDVVASRVVAASMGRRRLED